MKIKPLLILLVLFLTFCSISYAQKPNNIESSFKKIIESNLISLKEHSKSEIFLPKYNKYIPTVTWNVPKSSSSNSLPNGSSSKTLPDGYWSLSKSEVNPYYSYDIIKTDSIVSPYKGIVTYYIRYMVKTGKTRDECLSSPWVVDDKNITIIYFYKNGNWVRGFSP